MGQVGDVVHSDDGYDMVVTKVDGRRIETIEVRRRQEAEDQADDDDDEAGEDRKDEDRSNSKAGADRR